MGFRKDAWASVWSVEEGRGNTMKVRISTSRKKKDSDEYSRTSQVSVHLSAQQRLRLKS